MSEAEFVRMVSQMHKERDDLKTELAEARAQIERIKETNQGQYDEGYKHGLAEADHSGLLGSAYTLIEVLHVDLTQARAQIAAIEATDRRLIDENGRLQARIAAKDEEIERIKDSNQQHYDKGYEHGLAFGKLSRKQQRFSPLTTPARETE